MSIRKCVVRGCPHMVKTGLYRSGKGTHGQQLADGVYCWRCRRRQAADVKEAKRPEGDR